MQRTTPQEIIVLGAGHFGTCLAQHLAELGHEVTLWARSKTICEAINHSKRNPKYLSNIKLHEQISAIHVLKPEVLKDFSTIVVAIPTQHIREVIKAVSSGIQTNQLLISAAKGIEQNSLCLPSEILAETLGERSRTMAAYLSGPSFASEVAEGQPTAVTMASYDKDCANKAQKIFHAPNFRVYTSQDPIGIGIAGALKNVVAIAAGACVGLGFKANASSALITRGLAEIARLGVALGANPITFKGLGGVGDLFLTCSSKKSRNYTVGYRLAKGDHLKDIVETLGSVAEGIATTKAAYQLGMSHGVRLSITTAVYQVLYEGLQVNEVVQQLLHASARQEFE